MILRPHHAAAALLSVFTALVCAAEPAVPPSAGSNTRSPEPSLTSTQAFDDAVLAYGEGLEALRTKPTDATARFSHAASLFEWLIEQRGVTAGPVLHNLGLAHLMAGNNGRAVLALRRAERALPLNADVRASLAAAREKAETRPMDASNTPRTQHILRRAALYFGAIPESARIAALLLANAAAWLFLAFRILGRRGPGAAPIAAAFAVAVAAGFSVLLPREMDRRFVEAVILTPNASLLASPQVPGPDAPSEGTLRAGEEVLITAERADDRGIEHWLRVKTAAGREGWVRADDAARISRR